MHGVAKEIHTGQGALRSRGQRRDQARRRRADRLAVHAQREVALVFERRAREPHAGRRRGDRAGSLHRPRRRCRPARAVEQLARAAQPPLGDAPRHAADCGRPPRRRGGRLLRPPALARARTPRDRASRSPNRAPRREVIRERVAAQCAAPPSAGSRSAAASSPRDPRSGSRCGSRARPGANAAPPWPCVSTASRSPRALRARCGRARAPSRTRSMPIRPGRLLDRLVREDRLVADRDGVLVDAVLEAPDPPRRVAHHA